MTNDILVTNFTHPEFQTAFKEYFAELGVHVTKWDSLFQEMNAEGHNKAFLRLSEDNAVIGFILFTPSCLEDWFFRMPVGFIREFWVAPAYRQRGHGSALLTKTEAHFCQAGIHRLLLTTDTAESFYLHRGYKRDSAIHAKNNDDVYVKKLC